MKPNRVAARFISGGKHQTFTDIARSPLRTKTITNKGNRRKQYQASKRREQREKQAARRREQREAAAARKKAAAAKKAAPRPPRKRAPSPVIATNPRTGEPITLAQAMKAYREANARADRIAAGKPADAPARAPRKRSAKAPAPAKKTAPRKKAPAKNAPPPPPPPPEPGKSLRGIYLAATCKCQGTGRIATVEQRDGVTLVAGSVSCPVHGRNARGGRKVLSRRAMTDAGLPGIAGWLDAKYRRPRGNLDRKQERAVRQSGRARYAGPTVACGSCDEGIVNRAFTDQLRERYIADLVRQAEASENRVPAARKLRAAASRAYPYDRCRACRGLGVVPDEHAGAWFGRTQLRAAHRPTARELATGRRTPGQRT